MRTYYLTSKSNKLFLLLFFLTLLQIKSVYAETYYVSPSGSDSNPGLSPSNPLKTINNALSRVGGSGDIVYVMTGTYVETVTLWQSGITLAAYPNNKPVINGKTTLPNRDWGSLIGIGGSYNTVSGFELKNSNINGIYLGGYGIEVEGHHNTISNMNVHHTREQGILIHGDYNIVEDSTVWQAALSNSNGQMESGWGTGISAARNFSSSALKKGITSYATLRRNTVFNNWGEGISCYEADHCLMEDNVAYDNWTVNLYLSDAINSLVQRNMIYISSAPAIPIRNNSRAGILLADEVAEVPRSANNEIINNLIYNADFGAFTWSDVANAGLNNVLIANNTIVDGNLSIGRVENIVNINSQVKNNIVLGDDNYVPNIREITFSNNNWLDKPQLAASSTDIVGDPLIARTGATTPGSLTPAYFKILTGSPAINAASTLQSVIEDAFKTIRDIMPDIGAHEYIDDSSGNIDSHPPHGEVVIEPLDVASLPTVTLILIASDDPSSDESLPFAGEFSDAEAMPSGVKDMIISNRVDFEDDKWQPYQSSLQWQAVFKSNGNADVFVKFRDAAGNESELAFASVHSKQMIDTDEDGVLDNADNCRLKANATQENSDGDSYGDTCDNCTLIGNEAQRDTDKDGYGNRCDADFNNNCIVDAGDFTFFKKKILTTDPDADLNGNGIVDAADFTVVKKSILHVPGPSAYGDCKL